MRSRWQLLPSNETCDDEISVYDDEISDDPIEQSNVTPEINSTDNTNYRTRSGRIIRQPDRYGYEWKWNIKETLWKGGVVLMNGSGLSRIYIFIIIYFRFRKLVH